MKTMHHFKSVIGVAALLTLGACADMNYPSYSNGSNTSYPQSSSSSGSYVQYGVVQSIDVIRQDNSGIGGSGIGVGAVAGAVVGGILGNQVGGGSGKTAATVLGAAGGAYAGHEIQKRNQQQQPDAYQFSIRLNNGSYQTVTQSTVSDIRIGDRVVIENGTARRY